jgi:hypothetical protein
VEMLYGTLDSIGPILDGFLKLKRRLRPLQLWKLKITLDDMDNSNLVERYRNKELLPSKIKFDVLGE